MKKLLFLGLSGRSYPYVRVRCYDFAAELKKYGVPASVVSFRDHLSGGLSELEMWDRGDREKLALSLRAFRRILRERPRLIYIQKIHYNAAVPYLLSRLGAVPYVLDYDDWDDGIECLFKRGWLNRFFFGHELYPDILRSVASRARACVVSSRYLKERLSEYNRRVWMIPTGVDTEIFTPAPRRPGAGKVVFAWTGVVWGEIMLENLLFMLECFRMTARRVRGVALRIVGGGQLMPDVKEIVSRDYGDLDIRIGEWVDHARMPEFLSRVDVGLLPLIQGEDSWVAGKSPTKFFEYMAMGLPTVSSRVGELRHVVSDGDDGFLADGKEEFSEKMIALASSPGLRDGMGRRAREKAVAEYDIAVLGKRLFDALSESGVIE